MLDVPLEQLLTDGQLDLDPAGPGRYFTFQLRKSQLRLQALGYVGFVPINDRVAVDIIPRCPIANLGRVLSIGGFAPTVIENFTRSYAVDAASLPNLRDLYAESLLNELRLIEAMGRLKEYEQREARTSSPRGRLLLRATETQLAALGASATVRASWFERTSDVAANRCLKMATWLLARAYAQSANPTRTQRRLATQLNAAYGLFEDAALDPRFRFLDDPIVSGRLALPSTRSYYRNALDIARLVVRSSSLAFDRAGADLQMPSVVIEMFKVFENYVRQTLVNASAGVADPAVLDGNRDGKKDLYDTPPSDEATPDIVINVAGSTVVVLDVKYKPADGKPSRDDLNQVIAYGASYRAPVVVVVQPRAEGSLRTGLIRLGDIAPISVYQYVMDLNGDLFAAEAALVREVFGLARASAGPAIAAA